MARRESAPHYVVTGGCGFIGRHLVRALLAEGSRVTILDDLSNSTAAGLPDGVDLVVGSVTDEMTVARVMRGAFGCFHLAAIASVPLCEANWLAAHKVNAGGTVTVLNAARALDGSPPVPVVFASSAAVYGDQTSLPIAESAQTHPQSVYGADKLGGEISGAAAAASFGVPFTALRFFNIYGPGQDPRSPYSGVISKFADLALDGDAITIFGDGQQTRDFVYVGDVVRHLTWAMKTTTPDARILNVCSNQETPINDLARLVHDLTGGGAQIVKAPRRGFEIARSLGDNSKARAALGLVADHSLTEGLAELLAYLKCQRLGGLPAEAGYAKVQ